ncbi:class F sortase [Saccharomonospora xinjiangensis]|uniref:Sortase (Surface protein transpeptidase) n=1 Tax=Saccharomonospora xinjiangensis XJ-54 TaxID=882086 RepID=I0UYA7_9PSEU|nr:class F sortase [Saccharomonospora xinjiangensis]EID52860.1 sortase (surface protein transpeptidase) [Saccharomonospora xinjiangensis XJ-54]
MNRLWRSPVWQRRAATVLGVLAVLAVTSGTAVLRSAPSPSSSSSPADRPSPSRTVPADDQAPGAVIGAGTTTAVATDAAREPLPASRRPGPQPPSSVRLPGGATSALVRTGLTADGTLPIPDGVGHAAWWGADFGDDDGAALVAGHVNWHGRSGPFTTLRLLSPGDEVSVRDAGGGMWTYRVDSATTLHKARLGELAPELFDQDGPHRLLLVTCDGDYLGGSSGYSGNLIVSATPVGKR